MVGLPAGTVTHQISGLYSPVTQSWELTPCCLDRHSAPVTALIRVLFSFGERCAAPVIMIDVLDLIAERGGNPDKVRESQRKRFAPESVVDEVIALWQDARKSESERNNSLF